MTYRRNVVAVGLVVAAVVTAGGCGGSSKANPGLNQAPPTTSTSTSTASAAPSTTSADPTAQAKTDALAAYNGMVKAMTKEFDTNQPIPDLVTYTEGAAYMNITSGLTSHQQNKVIYVGQPQSSPKVTAANPSSNPNTVTISDCFGGPGWKAIFAADVAGHKKGQDASQPVPPAPLTATVVNGSGSWRVTKYTFNFESTC